MLGERDSEVAVIVEDADVIDGKMNGALASGKIFSQFAVSFSDGSRRRTKFRV